MNQLEPAQWQEEQTFLCENGMEVFHYPIFFRGSFMGFIQSGYIRPANSKNEKLKDVYDVPESVIAGIHALLLRVVKAIRNFCEFEYFRKRLTDLKINNHFLFNTLNSMASMALDGGMVPLYQSIVDLSKMFHYTLRTQSSAVTMEKEIDYVKAYLQLQKLRYREDLSVCLEVEKEVLNARVPFNFLQPVVENAFVHGFQENTDRRIRLVVHTAGDDLEILVINSGKRLSPQECKVINQGIVGNTAHGLAMIQHKLRAFYEKSCVFEIGTEENGDTCFRIRFPYDANRRKKNDSGSYL